MFTAVTLIRNQISQKAQELREKNGVATIETVADALHISREVVREHAERCPYLKDLRSSPTRLFSE